MTQTAQGSSQLKALTLWTGSFLGKHILKVTRFLLAQRQHKASRYGVPELTLWVLWLGGMVWGTDSDSTGQLAVFVKIGAEGQGLDYSKG